MKSKKLFLLFILMLAVIMLAGCGTESDTEKKKSNNDEQAEETGKYSNVGNYAEYNGNVYYWKLTADSRDGAALFAQYSPVKGYKNDLTRLEPDGNEFAVVNTAGSGNIYIANDTIFYQSSEDGSDKIYSVDLDGNNKKSYCSGVLKYASGDYIYVQNGSDVTVINAKEQEEALTLDDADLIGIVGSNAYFIGGDSSKEIDIGYIEEGVPMLNVATFSTSEYKTSTGSDANITFYGFSYENNKVQIKVGDVQGTGHFVQEGWIIEMDADGQNVTKKIDSANQDNTETLLSVTELPVSYVTSKGLVYKDPDNGSEKTIVDNSKIKSEFGFKTYGDDEEAYIEVYAADKVDDKLYIVIDNGTHYSAGDIGWRYSYRRTKTAVFKYDLGSGEIDKLYEF